MIKQARANGDQHGNAYKGISQTGARDRCPRKTRILAYPQNDRHRTPKKGLASTPFLFRQDHCRRRQGHCGGGRKIPHLADTARGPLPECHPPINADERSSTARYRGFTRRDQTPRSQWQTKGPVISRCRDEEILLARFTNAQAEIANITTEPGVNSDDV